MFNVGDRVIYGMYGLCQVENISPLEMEGADKNKLYYYLKVQGSNRGTIYAAVDNPRTAMRLIMSREEIAEMLDRVPVLEPLEVTNEKQIEEVYRNHIKDCDMAEWFRVLITIYGRRKKRLSQGKKTTTVDDRYMKKIEDYLFGELAIILDMDRKQVPLYLKERFSQM